MQVVGGFCLFVLFFFFYRESITNCNVLCLHCKLGTLFALNALPKAIPGCYWFALEVEEGSTFHLTSPWAFPAGCNVISG